MSSASVEQREADAVREALFSDPFTTNEDYGRLMQEAADADDLTVMREEVPEP
jgi:hypothetical protein